MLEVLPANQRFAIQFDEFESGRQPVERMFEIDRRVTGGSSHDFLFAAPAAAGRYWNPFRGSLVFGRLLETQRNSGYRGYSRLSRARAHVVVEMALFRVSQESLTNIHRHAESSRADVSLRMAKNRAILRVRDYGPGIAPGTPDHFLKDGTHVGVGLAECRSA